MRTPERSSSSTSSTPKSAHDPPAAVMTFSAEQSIPLRVRTFSAIRSRNVPRPAVGV